MDAIIEALDDLMRYADTCELFLRETHPGKADALRVRVRKAMEALAAKSVPVVVEPVAWINAEKLSKVRKGYLLNVYLHGDAGSGIDNLVPLYSAPPKSVSVIGEPVAYRAEKLDQDPVYKYSFQEADWFLPDEIGECQEPLYLKPASSITEAEIERLRKDAERYAMVRDSTYCDVYMHEIYLNDDDLDAAIDAAIAGISNRGERENEATD